MKKFLIILIIIFICGILSADVCLKQLKESNVLVGLEYYEQYATANIAFKDVFWNVLYERIKFFAFLILLCFTPMKEKIGSILMPLFFFVWGFFLMSCIIELGAGGFVIGLACVFPHGILYVAAVWLLVRQKHTRGYHLKNKIGINIGRFLFFALLFITACVMESLMGTHFIPWVIRLSTI